MQKFVLNLLIAAIQNDKIRALLFELAERVAIILLPKLAAIVPAAVAAGIKGLGDILPNIDMPDLNEIVETVRKGVNDQLPEDVDIPVLSDIFTSVTGLDLSDLITGRKH